MTIDAIGAQKQVVKTIIDKGADYVISLKKNQPSLHAATEAFFADAREENFETVPLASFCQPARIPMGPRPGGAPFRGLSRIGENSVPA